LKSVGSTQNIQSFFKPKDTQHEEKVRAAEATLAFHSVNHHHSYNSLNCSSKLQKTLFPDSKIAKEVTCAKTKAEALINSVISPHSIDLTVDVLNGISCFGLETDGSNHGAVKIFPILIQYFDPVKDGLTTKLIEVKSTPDETAQTI
jgi:hypothetical protein